MKESQVINAWMRQGELEGELRSARKTLLRLVELQLAKPVPEDLRLAIEGTNDLGTLDRWFDQAATSDTLEQFRTATRQAP